MSDQAGNSPKGFSNWGIILAKGQFDHSYTFWTMPILIFSLGANFGHHPLVYILLEYITVDICRFVLERWLITIRTRAKWSKITIISDFSGLRKFVCFVLFVCFIFGCCVFFWKGRHQTDFVVGNMILILNFCGKDWAIPERYEFPVFPPNDGRQLP